VRKTIGSMHVGLAWVILAAVIAQFFFAGLGIFGAAGFGAHKTVGYLVIPAALILLVLALAGRLGGLRIGLSALLFVLAIIQSMLPSGPAVIAALHPVNALAILAVVGNLARLGMMERAPSHSARPVIESAR
jgi:hypothetical protein